MDAAKYIAALPIQCRAKQKCIETHCSADTAEYGVMQQTTYSRASVDRGHRQLRLCWAQEHRHWTMNQGKTGQINHDLSFITLVVVSGYTVFHANGFSFNVQQVIHRAVVVVLCFGGRSLKRLWHPWLE